MNCNLHKHKNYKHKIKLFVAFPLLPQPSTSSNDPTRNELRIWAAGTPCTDLLVYCLIGYEPQRKAWCDLCSAVLDYRIRVLSSIYPRECPPQPTKASGNAKPSPCLCLHLPLEDTDHHSSYCILITHTQYHSHSYLTHSFSSWYSYHTHSQPDQEAIPSSAPRVFSSSVPILTISQITFRQTGNYHSLFLLYV